MVPSIANTAYIQGTYKTAIPGQVITSLFQSVADLQKVRNDKSVTCSPVRIDYESHNKISLSTLQCTVHSHFIEFAKIDFD
jgi:hypothetical protein